MSIRGNSGFKAKDRRFGTFSGDTKGIIGREQHFLERINGRFSTEPYNPIPNILNSATLWYDATENVTTGGTAPKIVETWGDKSPSGLGLDFDFVTERLEYSTANSALNNKPSVNIPYDGSSTEGYMDTGDTVLLDGWTDLTIYFACRFTDVSDSFGYILGRPTGIGWGDGWHIWINGSNSMTFAIDSYNSSNSSVSLTFSDTTNGHIVKMVFDSTGTQLDAEIIGPGGSSGSDTSATTPINDVINGIVIGAGNDVAYGTGVEFGEIIIFDSVVSTSDQTDIENYLKTKFNIS